MKLPVITDIDLGDEERAALSDFIYGNKHHDLDGGFESGGVRHQAAHIVLTTDAGLLPDAHPIGFRHIGSFELPEETYLLLRDDAGQLHDMKDCSEWVTSKHHYGLLFEDRHGQVWLASIPEGETSEDGTIEPGWPLTHISKHLHPTVKGAFGDLKLILPSSGEFNITEGEIPPRITWIPWCSGFGSNPEEGLSFPNDDATLEVLKDRVDTIRQAKSIPRDPEDVIREISVSHGGANIGLPLFDHRPASDIIVTDPGVVRLSIEARDTGISIRLPDGREVLLELEGADLKVHAYNDMSDTPVHIVVGNGREIEVDATDYLEDFSDPEREGVEP